MGIRLYVEESDSSKRVLDLKGAVTIGRGADNHVVLKDQRSSRRHCRISETPQGVVLEDLQSANGTTLNGKTVSRSFVKAGDEFRVGDTKFIYQPLESGESEGGRPATPPPAAAGDGAGGPGSAPPRASELPPTERVEAPARGGAARAKAAPRASDYLTCLEGPEKGENFLIDRSPLVMGRKRGCDICLRDQRVSSRHAQLVRERGHLLVEDLGSKNGIVLDGRKVRRGVLVTGSRLVIGSYVFTATVPGSKPAKRRAPSGVRDAGAPQRNGGEEPLLTQVDMERYFAGDRIQQPLIAGALVVVVGLLSYFAIDIAQRLLIEKELDPASPENRISRNWSFEEKLPEGAVGIPGWSLGPSDEGSLEITKEQAQYPGASALKLVSSGDDDLCAAVHQDLVALGSDRRFVLEGYIGNQGAFFAALLVEWMRSLGEEMGVVERDFSEAAREPDSRLDVFENLTVPGNCTHARISCVVYGGAGGAIFDRISFAAAAEDASGAEGDNGDGERAFGVGDDKGRLTLRLTDGGDYRLTTGKLRLVPSIWAALDPEKDPLFLGPRLVPPVFESGDRGALRCATDVPDVAGERWAVIQSAVAASASEISISWQLVSRSPDDDPDRLVVYLEASDGRMPVVVHPGGGGLVTFGAVTGERCGEIVVGRRDSRVSMIFSSPVSLESLSRPEIQDRWIVAVRPAAKESELRVSFVPGSRREKQGAIALLREANRLHQEASIAKAWKTLVDLPRLYPEQKREIEQARALLEEWREEAEKTLADFAGAIEELRRSPTPVIYESLVDRGNKWAERYAGTDIGGKFRGRVGEIESYWRSLHSERAAAALSHRYDAARSHYRESRYGLAELYLRSLLESGIQGDMERQARRYLKQIEDKREHAARRLLLR